MSSYTAIFKQQNNHLIHIQITVPKKKYITNPELFVFEQSIRQLMHTQLANTKQHFDVNMLFEELHIVALTIGTKHYNRTDIHAMILLLSIEKTHPEYILNYEYPSVLLDTVTHTSKSDVITCSLCTQPIAHMHTHYKHTEQHTLDHTHPVIVCCTCYNKHYNQ